MASFGRASIGDDRKKGRVVVTGTKPIGDIFSDESPHMVVC